MYNNNYNIFYLTSHYVRFNQGFSVNKIKLSEGEII